VKYQRTARRRSKMTSDYFALVRNDDGHPVIIEIFPNRDAAEEAKKQKGPGYFIHNITEGEAR
jgi:hypothetical protein